jgi:Flp pilus assembly protein TadD/HEAT repeat protein
MRRSAFALVLVLLAAPSVRADWEVKRSPFDARLVARYKQILHRDPDDADALAKLTALYKQYRTVDDLRRELTAATRDGDANDGIVLGRFLVARGDLAGAADAFAKVLAAHPADVRATLALGDVALRQGQGARARGLYESGLPHVSDGKRRRPLLHKLADLALAPDRGLSAERALEEARRYYDELLRLDPRDDDTRREWAEALAARGQPRAAAGEWRAVAERLARDPARQGQAWLRVGALEEAAGDDEAARVAYDKTFALAPKGNYLRRDAADRIVGLARKRDRLRALVGEWERAWPESGRDFGEWELLGRLYDELGDADRAQADFRRALALDPHAIDARKRLIALYERTGRDAEALAEYRRLVAAAPGEAHFRVELAERLMKSGDGRAEALKLAEELGRQTNDPAVHAQLGELYARWGLPDLALREQELLVRLEPDDESHVVALGELYWQKGNKKRALDEWHKLLGPSGRGARVQAMARLAEVYVEHDMAPEALDLYQKAARQAPDDATVQKGLGATLERLHRDREAEEVWAQLFERAAAQKQRAAQLETRQRLLTVLARQGRLGLRVADYRGRADKEPDEQVAAAYALFCADALVKMGRAEMAEELLHRLADRAKSPSLRADAWVGIAQVERARRRLREALAALKTAAELMPDRGRELYPQIAELSLQLYQDADALTYAKRAVELGPADAAAQVRLGEVLEKREDLAGAAQAYQRAVEIDERQWKVYFTLARLELRRGQEAHAAELYRAVMRRAPDEELVLDAARRAIDLEEYLGSLGDLERELSPLAYAHADKPVYRSLLLELYDRYGTPLVTRARAGDSSVKKELERLGEHGLRPLLDVLVDGEQAQQRVAVALLGAFGNPSAAPALLKLALTRRLRNGRSDRPERPERTELSGRLDRGAAVELREQAALAAAELASARELPSLLKLQAEPEKQLRVAAAYGLGRIADKRAQAALVAALDDGSVDVQAMACLALGAHPDGRAWSAMLERLRANERSPEARLGCAFALGLSAPRLSASERAAARTALVATLAEGADDVQRAAAWALGAVDHEHADAVRALVQAALVKRDEVRRTALLALSHGRPLPSPGAPDFVARSDDGADVKRTLAHLGELTMAPLDDADRDHAASPLSAARGHDDALVAALVDALGRHRDIVLRALADLEEPPPEVLAPLWPRLLPSLRALTTHADATVRAALGRLVARAGDVELTIAALSDRAPAVRLAALSALAPAAPLSPVARAALVAPVERALKASDFRERRQAVLVAAAHPELWPDKGARVLAPLKRDPSGFVREALR